MYTAILAHGPNEVVIPAMIFPTPQEARDFIEQLSEEFPDVLTRKETSWRVNEGEEQELMDKLFFHYYDGCGGIYKLTLETFNFGAQMVAFSLD